MLLIFVAEVLLFFVSILFFVVLEILDHAHELAKDCRCLLNVFLDEQDHLIAEVTLH